MFIIFLFPFIHFLFIFYVAPTASPSHVRAEPISSKSIRLKWRPPRQQPAFGSVAGYYVGHKLLNGAGSTENNNGERSQYVFSTLELGALSMPNLDRIRSKNRSTETGATSGAGTEELQFDVHGLHRGSLYSLVVQAFNSKGAGPSSAEVQCRTKEKDPPSIPRFRIVRVSVSSVTVGWLPSGEQPGEVTGKDSVRSV